MSLGFSAEGKRVLRQNIKRLALKGTFEKASLASEELSAGSARQGPVAEGPIGAAHPPAAANSAEIPVR